MQNKRNLLFQVQTDAATKTDAPTKMNFFAYVISCKQIKMGDSRKYPYHTMDGFSEFRGQGGGGFFELEFQRQGGVLTKGILKAWGGVRLGV